MAKKAGKIALGLGLITGTLAGLLFAPEEGKKIRQKISKGDTKGLLLDLQKMGDDMLGLAKNLAKEPSVRELIENAKDKAAEVTSLKRDELDALLDMANKKAEDFKARVAAYVAEQKAELEEVAKEMGVDMKKTAKKTAKKVVKKAVKASTQTAKTVSKAAKKVEKGAEKVQKSAAKAVKVVKKTAKKV